MFAPTRYLEWARRLYGTVRFDLASSGIPSVKLAELGAPHGEDLDDPSGWAALRGAIARYNDVPEAEAVATLGAAHAVWLGLAALTSPGDDVLVEAPAYEPLVRIAAGLGARVVPFERPATTRFAVDPERVARAMTARTRVVVLTDLHNPSGARADPAAIRAIADLAAARGATVLVDEVYAPFDALVDGDGVFRRSARKLAPNVLAAGSLTKCYGLGQHRFGWLLGPPEAIARAEDVVLATCVMFPLAHAHLALRAFRNIGWLAERARARVAGKRARVARWVEAQGLEWSAPAEGLFALVTVPDAADLTATIEAAARDRQVLVAAGSFFGQPACFRLAWSAPEDALDEGLARLAEALRGAPRA